MRAADLVVGRLFELVQAKTFSVSLVGPPTKPLTLAIGHSFVTVS